MTYFSFLRPQKWPGRIRIQSDTVRNSLEYLIQISGSADPDRSEINFAEFFIPELRYPVCDSHVGAGPELGFRVMAPDQKDGTQKKT